MRPLGLRGRVALGFAAGALLPLAEQCRHRHTEVLAEQVEQGRLDRRDGVDRGPQVEGLRTAAAGIAHRAPPST